MKKKRIAIIHFQPPELYPPVMNVIRVLGQQLPEAEIVLYTTACRKKIPAFIPPGGVRIRRSFPPQEVSGGLRKTASYFWFYLSILASLVRRRPEKVIYFETISSFPALVYKWLFPGRTGLFVHYHEYGSNEEIRRGMKLNHYFHLLEMRSYGKVQWLSHTNQQRMERFLAEHGNVRPACAHILPNYPPRSWCRGEARTPGDPLKIVYVGALGMDSMYIKEFAEWVLRQNGRVIWDIYTNNMSEAARAFFQTTDPHLIRLKNACDYYELPVILPDYEVGIVFYKGVIPNHVYAVSNKVFEYLACGLDVWYSDKMKGTDPLKTQGVFPKVISVNFERLDAFSLNEATSRTGLVFHPVCYSCEDVLTPFVKELS